MNIILSKNKCLAVERELDLQIIGSGPYLHHLVSNLGQVIYCFQTLVLKIISAHVKSNILVKIM